MSAQREGPPQAGATLNPITDRLSDQSNRQDRQKSPSQYDLTAVQLLANKAERLLGPLVYEANTGLAMAANQVAPHPAWDLYKAVLAELETRRWAARAKSRGRK